MENALVIVESPAKARTIEKYLGTGYTVTASTGHLRDLPKSTIGVDIEKDFTPDYEPIAAKSEIISRLQKEAKSADMVFLATDPDREGEAISWHLKELLKLPEKKTARVTFNEITKKVVLESIQKPRQIDMDLTVKTTRTQQGGVEHVGTVGCRQDDHTRVCAKAVHLRQQGIQRVLTLIVAPHCRVL